MAQTDCPQTSLEFQGLGSRKVRSDFNGGHLSSDGGGALFLREVEARCGIIGKLATCFDDRRNPELIEHSVPHLPAQRINGLAMGYEDLNGHDSLRLDPAEAPDARYRKVVAEAPAIGALLIGEGVKAIPRKSKEIVIDFDATDDPLHGAQEGAYFNGYYRHYCYLPLYAFCGNV